MKHLINKTILVPAYLLLWCVLGAKAHAQGMPVYDNTNFVSLAKSLVESAKQTSELLKTVEFLREQKARIEVVSNVIKQWKAVRDLTRNHQRLFDMMQHDLRDLLNSPHIKPEEVHQITESFNAIMERALDDLDFVSQLLTNNTLNMTDAERILWLREKEMASRDMVVEMEAKTRRYREIIAFRSMQDAINNRTGNY